MSKLHFVGTLLLLPLLWMNSTQAAVKKKVKKNMEHRLYERAKAFFVRDYNSCNQLWDFGGIVLVNAQDKRQGCISPEGNWKDFVILHFSDYMTSDKNTQKAAEDINEKAA